MKGYIECAGCNQRYRCDVNKSVIDCAKKYNLITLSYTDYEQKHEESIFLCRKCFEVVRKLFFSVEHA